MPNTIKYVVQHDLALQSQIDPTNAHLVFQSVARMAGKRAMAIDMFLFERLKAKIPPAYFIARRKYLRFLMPVFRLQVISKEIAEGEDIEIQSWGICIGRMFIAKLRTV
jgi:hypothetical protein